MILVIKHIDIEGPGTLGDFLQEKKISFQTVELGKGESLPKDLDAFRAVVVLGGPMNVYEEKEFPFLREEDVLIKEVLKKEIPFLGICLGAQLLAKAAGAKVVKSPVKEIGWYKISLTPEGKKDPFLKGFDEGVEIYHWHEDMFQIPSDGALLATGPGCPHQAFRVGKNAYGVQFHIEITDKSIKEWSEEYCQKDLPGRQGKCDEMLRTYARTRKDFLKQAYGVYENFLKIVKEENNKEKGFA